MLDAELHPDASFPSWSGSLKLLAYLDIGGWLPESAIAKPRLEIHPGGVVEIKVEGLVTVTAWRELRNLLKRCSRQRQIAGMVLAVNSAAQQVEGAKQTIQLVEKITRANRVKFHSHISGDTRGVIYTATRACEKCFMSTDATIGPGELGQPFQKGATS